MTKTTRLATALLLSLAALGAAQAASAADQLPGDKYGYSFRSTVPGDKYGYEFRSHDVFTEGARARRFDPFVDGARTVAGLDRSGVSAAPARSFDTFTEGSRTGKFDAYGEGARA
ncbi:hypothetical protein BJN34_34360 [Cupriavidus necator]|uniref:Copper resistance protein CopQ n=1 Tax=Cupriavidus necator TaxID=106590 RepID=A0A1U9V1W6_CUPNE|nr:hypothetical protein [Cupriavidus necator]AQV98964.1 hypothetical protein BJN34_34360 [Cupriavidus necator]